MSPGELPWKAEPGGQENAKGALEKWQINTWHVQKLHRVKMLLGKADAPKGEDSETFRERHKSIEKEGTTEESILQIQANVLIPYRTLFSLYLFAVY